MADGDEGRQGTAAFLHGVALFDGLTEAMRIELAEATETVRVTAGDWLFRQGDPGESMFLVRSGRVEIVMEDPPPSRVIDVLGPGSALGELALLVAGRRTASLRALRDSELFEVRRDRFDALLESDPAFGAGLSRVLAAQLQRRVPATAARPRRASVITVLGLTAGPPVPEVAAALAAELGRWGPSTVLDFEGATGELPATGGSETGDAAFGRTLDLVEQRHDTVVLEAPVGWQPTSWTRFCTRQADRVVAIVDPQGESPAALDPHLAGCDVAFWTRHPTEAPLRSWFDRLAPGAHHFLTPDSRPPKGVDRLARRLAGRSLGLVLSGGGARGLAHVGVIGVLADAGLLIDRVGGTSMGSLIGGLFALGLDTEEIEERCRAELCARNPFNDYTVPRYGLIKARKAEAMLNRLFGRADIEASSRSMFAVSADLVTGEEVIHRRGPLAVAVGISMCLPGLVPPVPMGGRLLVDGGVLNNLPVDVMAAADEGPIIAVDVMRKTIAGSDQTGTGDGPVLPMQRSLPGARVRLPTLLETLGRSSVMGSWRKAEANRPLASLVISPELVGVGLLDFKKIDQIIREGRQAANSALATNNGGLILEDLSR